MSVVSIKNSFLSDILNFWDGDKSAASMMNLVADLFPIHRTLINSGYKKSLEMIAELLPIEIEKYASGMKAWDWTIPNAWDVKEAWIADSHGNKLVDFAENNLHLSQYSAGFDGILSHDDLMEHLYWREDLHDAIPFNFLYFNDSGKWQFNIAFSSLKKFLDEKYHVHIDVEEYPDFLRIGSLYLPGKTDKEVIVSTYLCHPSMANDNLSGIVASIELFKILQQYEKRYYSYRLLILPETIGSITWMANHEEELDRIVAGLVISNCGDSGPVTYKQTYSGINEIDLIAGHVLSQSKLETEVKSYTLQVRTNVSTTAQTCGYQSVAW